MSSSSSPLSSIASFSSPSSPLSLASRSPSLPAGYPSPPPSSNVSDISSSLSDAPESLLPDRDDSPPPAKKQKLSTPTTKELKTEYLDLIALNDSCDESVHQLNDPQLAKLMKILRTKKRIVVIAGAGISVSAGSMLAPTVLYVALLTIC
jgi:NAD-dependent histone deacetylase SIR2